MFMRDDVSYKSPFDDKDDLTVSRIAPVNRATPTINSSCGHKKYCSELTVYWGALGWRLM